jgi:SAM-dependent methyltransferase
MHPSARRNAEAFVKRYLASKKEISILEVGSRDVNGSLRDLFTRPGWTYKGLDRQEGHNVDIVSDYVAYGSGSFPIAKDSFDVIVSTSCLEHDPWFWVTFAEMVRVCRPGGLIYICVPSRGKTHKFPLDCWRFQIDAYRALAMWVTPATELLDSYIDPTDETWQDNVGIFRKRQS